MLIIRCTKKIFICVAGISAFLEMYHIITLDHSRNCVASLYFADILYVLKVVQKFNTAYFDEFGILNRNKYMISQRYKKKGFYWDLISVLPLEVLCIVFVKQKKYMILAWSYLRANRLIRITQTMNFLINLKHKLNVNTFWVRMLNIFFNCIFLITLLCSFLYFVDSYTPSKFPAKDAKVKTFYRYWQMTMNMIMKMNIEYTRQMFDLNSAITLMPLMVMARFVALYFIASIVATAQVITRRKHLYEIFAIKIALYMENENISYPLMKLNNRYVSSLWLHYDGIQSPSLLDEAPYYLREGILNSMFGLHLRRHPVFKKCHIDLIRQISANFKVRRFFPGDIITYINDIDHCMYFIQEGVIQALSEDSLYNEVVDVTLISGNMFGFDQGIYLRAGHIYTYKVAENSLILLLKRDDWIYLLDYFPASALLLYDKHKEKELYS